MSIGRPNMVFRTSRDQGLPPFPLNVSNHALQQGADSFFRFFAKKVTLASKLAIGVSVLFFLMGYQPALSYPPIQPPRAVAQTLEQTTSISSQALPFAFQLPHPGYISTYYSSYHPAIDIATGLGMPIKPVAKGTVVSASFNVWGLGLTVVVDHGSGYRSSYSHMGRFYVQKGQEITENDLLGEVGMTGNTSGPHTHLEIFKDDKTINPLLVLPKLPDISNAYAMGGAPKPEGTSSAKVKTPTGGVIKPVAPKPTANPTPEAPQLSKIDFSKQLDVSL